MKSIRYYSFILFFLLQLNSTLTFAQTPPAGFASTTVSNGWSEAVGLVFNSDGTKMFVWERGGRVWVVVNGQRQLLLDISAEVGAWHDHGLLGFALDPHFDVNGNFYLSYLVDRHHLKNFGTGAYNPAQNDYFSATIGRVTRYTATPNGNGGYSVNPSSRKVLVGETAATGIPSLTLSHVTGAILFGTDNTLLIATGDGGAPGVVDDGSDPTSYYVDALADGSITQTTNIGAFRAQLLNCLSGKILRIDPETGAGIPSNPYYDPANPNSPKSKVYALGLRNPFRVSLKPGSGSHNPADGDPGVLYVGDVGWTIWEDLNIVDRPGMNFGWPIYEGYETQTSYVGSLTLNRDAPNPLYQVNGCNRQFFYFQELLKQQTASGTATFPNPCNATQNIPASIPTFEHNRPVIDWNHTNGQARTGTFSGQTATVTNIGAAGSPVSGPQFSGNCVVAGVFYTGADFPAPYQNSLFFGDFGAKWIRNMSLDANNKPFAVRNFIDNGAVVVAMATNPAMGGLYYIHFDAQNNNYEIRRVYFSANQPPIAVASVNNSYGASPLNVQFTGSASTDPEAQPLIYQWNFGDGTALSSLANPAHSFTAAPGVPTKYTVTLRVTDSQGVQNETFLVVSVNNTPPHVEITSPAEGATYPLTGDTVFALEANVSDDEHSANQLSYAWQTTLHHNNHQHSEPIDTSPSTTTSVAPLGCDGETYYYRVTLTVTDAAGASTKREVLINPDCSTVPKVTPVIAWSNPAPIASGTALTTTQLNAIAYHNGTPVAGTYTYTPGVGTVLPNGVGQLLSVLFTPTNTTLYNTATKTATIDVTSVSLLTPLITWANPAAITSGTALSSTQLNATASYNGSPVAGTFTYTPGVATVLPLGLAQLLSVSFAPTNTSLYTSVTKTATIDVVAPGALTFYRAININGAALVIDGNNYISSTGAPNFSFTGSNGAFASQGIPLIPATDADRATMIRSSIWGSNLNLSISAVPAGNYRVYVYVWEDNNPAIFSISLEGTVVQPNYNSGTAGMWSKLGPFTAAISDGTINIATAGGHANISGVEIWSLAPAANQPPVVANIIPDQTATVGTTYSFSFASNTFTDPNPGTVLTYIATLFNGAALPGWLTFSGVPRTFSGTPAAGDLGPIDVRVTASDGAGGSVSDVFSLTVSQPVPVTPVITWPNPASITTSMALTSTQLNATASHNGVPVAGVFTYTPGAGTVLPFGPGQVLSVSFAPTNTSLYTSATKTATIDVTDLLVPVITWANPAPITTSMPLSSTQLNATASYNGSPVTGTFTYTPDVGTTLPIGPGQLLSVSFAPTNTSLYTSATKTATIDVTDLLVPVITWVNPAPITTSMALTSTQLNATASYNGSPVAGTFTYTPDVGTTFAIGTGHLLSVSFAPTNTSLYATATKTVTIDVTDLLIPVITWANPGSIPSGTALSTTQLNATANYNGSPVAGTFTYTPGVGTVLPIGAAQLLSVNFAPTNASLYLPATKTATIDVTQLTPLITWANPAPITSGTALGATQLNATASYNGSPVAGTFTYTPGVGTVLPLGPTQLLSVSFAPTNTSLYTSATKTATINVVAAPTSAFYRAINLNGAAMLIDGNNWISSTGAPNFSFTGSNGAFASQGIPLIPSTDANRATMIRSSIWGTNLNIAISSIPAGSYQVYVYVWEDNNPAIFSISLEGTVVQSNYNSGTAGMWSKLGPFTAAINDGTINISAVGGHANISGVEIWSSAPVANQPPVVANIIPDQVATVGTTYGFSFASNTFTDPNPGTVLTYTASLFSGALLPGWLTFTGGTRTFTGTPASANVGTIDVRVTASDGAGGSVSDVFSLSVNQPVPVTPLITWANPSSITSGTALSGTQLNATASYNGTPVAGTFAYTPGVGTVLPVGAGQLLSVNFAPTNTSLYLPTTKTATINVTEFVLLTPVITWANPASITSGTALSATQLNAAAGYNGSPVAGIFTYTPGVGTVLPLGPAQLLSVSFAPTNTSLYTTATKTATINVVAAPTSAFYRAINLNGAALVIDGNNWISSNGAPNFSFTGSNGAFASQGITLIPSTDANRATMIRSSIWGTNLNVSIGAIPAGNYQVYVYVWEDNNPAIFSISLEGTVVQSNYNSGSAGMWSKLGPFTAAINDGTINILAQGGHANISGIEIWTVSQPIGGRLALIASSEDEVAENPDGGLKLSAHPNPISGEVNIDFYTVESGPTKLSLSDTRGIDLMVLFEGSLTAGTEKNLKADSKDLANGVYFLRLINGKQVKHIKLMVAH